jgi:SAM-dependent methyltransferase
MELQVTSEVESTGRTFAEMNVARSHFQHVFAARLLAEPGLKGRVLDIGCGGGLPVALRGQDRLFPNLDGVDVSETVAGHPLLRNRWRGCFEDSPVPAASYDLSFAYNVVEHIPDARRFFEKVSAVLKPGGVFWALTPNGSHPFCLLSRSIELIGMKPLLARAIRSKTKQNIINDIPSYYRLNRAGQVLRAIRALPFVKAHFVYVACVQWDTLFPVPLRWLPHGFDRVLGNRLGRCMLVLAYRLERGG